MPTFSNRGWHFPSLWGWGGPRWPGCLLHNRAIFSCTLEIILLPYFWRYFGTKWFCLHYGSNVMHCRNIIQLVNYLEIMAISSSFILAVPLTNVFSSKSMCKEFPWVPSDLKYKRTHSDHTKEYNSFQFLEFLESWILDALFGIWDPVFDILDCFDQSFFNRDVGVKETSATTHWTTLSYFLTQQQQRVQQLQGQRNL